MRLNTGKECLTEREGTEIDRELSESGFGTKLQGDLGENVSVFGGDVIGHF
jgi:hypothetical protein